MRYNAEEMLRKCQIDPPLVEWPYVLLTYWPAGGGHWKLHKDRFETPQDAEAGGEAYLADGWTFYKVYKLT